VREIKDKVKVRQIIILLLQFDTHILLAGTMTREKNLPIKAVKKNQQKIKKKLNWLGLVRGGSTLFPLLLCTRFFTQVGILV
jgi:hypothetical protein